MTRLSQFSLYFHPLCPRILMRPQDYTHPGKWVPATLPPRGTAQALVRTHAPQCVGDKDMLPAVSRCLCKDRIA